MSDKTLSAIAKREKRTQEALRETLKAKSAAKVQGQKGAAVQAKEAAK